jgi:hypothetical protein
MEVLLHDGGLGIGEADVEVALEGDEHAAHRSIRSISIRSIRDQEGAPKSALRGSGAGGESCKFQEIASLHGFPRASP